MRHADVVDHHLHRVARAFDPGPSLDLVFETEVEACQLREQLSCGLRSVVG